MLITERKNDANFKFQTQKIIELFCIEVRAVFSTRSTSMLPDSPDQQGHPSLS